MSRSIFFVVTTEMGGKIGIYWLEAKDAAKHPTMYRTAPETKDYLAPNVIGAEIEKLT